MDKLYIVIPAYNEEENIKAVINDWYPIVDKIGNGSRLVIIDDGSKDMTYSIIKEQADKLEALEAITKANGGHGATILYGYKYAIKKEQITYFRQILTDRHCRKNFGLWEKDRKRTWL